MHFEDVHVRIPHMWGGRPFHNTEFLVQTFTNKEIGGLCAKCWVLKDAVRLIFYFSICELPRHGYIGGLIRILLAKVEHRSRMSHFTKKQTLHPHATCRFIERLLLYTTSYFATWFGKGVGSGHASSKDGESKNGNILCGPGVREHWVSRNVMGLGV